MDWVDSDGKIYRRQISKSKAEKNQQKPYQIWNCNKQTNKIIYEKT